MHKVIARTNATGNRDESSGNAIGYFVQNDIGATVAGPYTDRFEAWREASKLDDAKAQS